jgi:hypothetical protein
MLAKTWGTAYSPIVAQMLVCANDGSGEPNLSSPGEQVGDPKPISGDPSAK